MSTFMEMYIYEKGRTYCADCGKCGCTNYIHEWVTDAFNEDRDAMRAGAYRCEHCHGTTRADTFLDCGRQYAGRYSADGYMDCTDWHYGKNKRELERELRAMYG